MNRKTINDVIHYLPVSSCVVGAPRKVLNLKEYVQNFPALAGMHSYGGIDFKKEMKELPSFFQQHACEEFHSLFLTQLERARVWGSNGAVIAQGDYFIKDVSREFNKGMNISHSIYYTLKQAKIRQLSGTAAVIGTAGAGIYYHWMLDILPRLALISKIISLEAVDYFVTGFSQLPFQTETLDKVGIPVSKIIPSNENWNFHIRAETLLVPSLAGPLDQPDAFQVDFLRLLYKDCISSNPPFRKLYISRKKTGRREIVNEDDLLDILSKHNFEIIHCEEMKVAEQVKLFSEASIIICSHGSALTNLVFCKPGTIVLDIFNTSHINSCFWFISRLNQLDYYFMAGKSRSIDSNPKNDNTIVDTEELILTLHRIGLQN